MLVRDPAAAALCVSGSFLQALVQVLALALALALALRLQQTDAGMEIVASS
jgi:hypothetical protein